MSGYHLKEIPKGVLGDSSKIMEELMELQDAENQKASIMQLVELSDLLGAIKLYLKKNFPGFTIEDLEIMSKITERAFISGDRE